MRGRRVVRLLAVTAVVLAALVVSRLMAEAAPAVRSPAVFLAARAVADLVALAFWPRGQAVIAEDFVRGGAVFAMLGLVAAGAIGLAERHLGGPINPAAAAVVAYLVLPGRFPGDIDPEPDA